jgi:type III restriction enzyme
VAQYIARKVNFQGSHPCELGLQKYLEIKGFEDDRTKAKHTAAKRWVAAVNNWGKLGTWLFHVCRNPQVLDKELLFLAQQAREAA